MKIVLFYILFNNKIIKVLINIMTGRHTQKLINFAPKSGKICNEES